MNSTTSRRTFLHAGLLAGAALLAPRPRRVRACAPPRARRILLVNADGGLRGTAAWNASPRIALNPWGVAGPAGALRLGRLLTASPGSVTWSAPSWPGAPIVPDFAAAAPAFAHLAAVDHAPGLPRAGDHSDDGPRMGTGWFATAAPGLLTVLSRHLGTDTPLPVVDLGNAGWLSVAAGDWVRYAPVALRPTALPSGAAARALPAGTPLEDTLDARLRSRRRGLVAGALDAYLGSKRAMRRYGPAFTLPTLDLAHPEHFDADAAGITNRMLLEAIGSSATDGDAGHPDAIGIALAVRMLQLGAPAAACGVSGFDTHSGEASVAPDLYTRFARYLAGLHFALSRVPDESGRPLLDTTLVVTTSELGRNATPDFDEHDGSDHGAGDSWRYQSHLLFGAGVRPHLLAPTDDDAHPTDGGRSTQSLLATLCAAAGLPSSAIDALWPPSSPLRPEKDPLWDLWA